MGTIPKFKVDPTKNGYSKVESISATDLKLAAEIEKLQAEKTKIEFEKKEIEKRINKPWYLDEKLFQTGIAALLSISGFWFFFDKFFFPVYQSDLNLKTNQVAIKELEVRRKDIKLDEQKDSIFSLNSRVEKNNTDLRKSNSRLKSANNTIKLANKALRREEAETKKLSLQLQARNKDLRTTVNQLQEQIRENKYEQEFIQKSIQSNYRNSTTATKISIANIYFDTDKYKLRPENIIILENIGKFLNSHQDIKISVESNYGYGTREYSITVGKNRAEAVANYLQRRSGVSPQRIVYVSYGNTKPVLPLHKNEAFNPTIRILNSATQIFIVKLE